MFIHTHECCCSGHLIMRIYIYRNVHVPFGNTTAIPDARGLEVLLSLFLRSLPSCSAGEPPVVSADDDMAEVLVDGCSCAVVVAVCWCGDALLAVVVVVVGGEPVGPSPGVTDARAEGCCTGGSERELSFLTAVIAAPASASLSSCPGKDNISNGYQELSVL